MVVEHAITPSRSKCQKVSVVEVLECCWSGCPWRRGDRVAVIGGEGQEGLVYALAERHCFGVSHSPLSHPPPSTFPHGSLSDLLPFTHTYYSTPFNSPNMDKIKEVSFSIPLPGGVACTRSSLLCVPLMHAVAANP